MSRKKSEHGPETGCLKKEDMVAIKEKLLNRPRKSSDEVLVNLSEEEMGLAVEGSKNED